MTLQINVLGGKKKVPLTFRTLSGGERGYLRLPWDINLIAKSVIRTLMLCGVNVRTHHRCETKDPRTDQASSSQSGPSLSVQRSLDFYRCFMQLTKATTARSKPAVPWEGDFRAAKIRLPVWERADKATPQLMRISCFWSCRNSLIFFLFLEIN